MRPICIFSYIGYFTSKLILSNWTINILRAQRIMRSVGGTILKICCRFTARWKGLVKESALLVAIPLPCVPIREQVCVGNLINRESTVIGYSEPFRVLSHPLFRNFISPISSCLNQSLGAVNAVSGCLHSSSRCVKRPAIFWCPKGFGCYSCRCEGRLVKAATWY